MKKIIIFIVGLILLAGCQNRAELVARFQTAYPDCWQRKLLEYDIEQQRLRDEYWRSSSLHQSQIVVEPQESFFISPPTSTNPNYWQEELARQQWWDRQYEDLGIRR